MTAPKLATAARKSFLLLLANLFGSTLGFIATLVVARLMGAEALGTIGYIMGLTGIVGFISNLGYAQAHFRYAAGKDDIGDQVSTYTLIVVLLTLTQTIVLTIVPLVLQEIGHPMLNIPEEIMIYIAFSVGLALTSVARIFSVTYQAQEEAAKVSLALTLSSLAVALAQIGVAVTGLGIVALGIAYQGEAAIKLFILWVTAKGLPFGRPKRAIAGQYSRYTTPIAVRNVLDSVYGNADKILLEKLASTQQVGFYVGNLGTAAAINRISVAIMRIFFPRTVTDIEQGNLNAVRKRLTAVLRYLLLVIVPIVAVVAAYSETIVRLTLGPEFLPSAATLSVLAIQAVIQVIGFTYTHVILALEKHAYLIPINLISTIILLVSNVLLIPTHLFGLPLAGLGSTGAAISLTLATISKLVMQVWVTSRFANIGFPTSLLWFVVGGGIMVFILRLPLIWQSTPALWSIPVLFTISLGAFTGLMLLTKQVARSEIHLFIQTLNPGQMVGYIQGELRAKK
jgi:O-antigen/teichoic acid export membrane protein